MYNNKVNHTFCNALGYKLFTFCVNIYKRHWRNKESWVDISKNTTIFHTLKMTNTSELHSNDDEIQEGCPTNDYGWLQGEGVPKMAKKVMA